MHSALKLKTKPTAQRYAGGGITKLMPKFAEGSTVTQYTSNVPEYAKENYADLVGRAQALSQAPYQTYDYDRIAQFTDLQNQGFGGLASLGVSPYSQQAGGIASNAANQAMNSYYGPSGFSTYGSGPQQVGTYGSSPQQVSGPGGPSQVSAYGSGAPQVTAPNMSQVGQVSGPGGPSQVGTQSFIKPGTASAYMNPYMQNVVDTQTREAVRSDDVARGSRNAQAVSAGAFGGSRQAIQEAEANRNLQTKLGDIQATGSNAAYQQAQQQFNTEQQLGLQGQQANQNAGLTTEQMAQQAKLANQQTGMQGLSLAQQAQQANQNAALGYGSQFLQAQQSNQNAGLTTQQMQQQAALANQQAGLSFGNQYLQAQQANQTAGLNYGNQYLDAQKMAEASRQFGATYGMQGLQTGLQGATMLGGLGNDIFKQQQTAAASQVAGGTQQQQQIQSILDQQYNDYQRQLNNPYQQLGFMSDILRGTQGTTSSIYKDTQTQTASPSNLQTLAGLGTIMSGLKAKGGSINSDDGLAGGLASIAPDDIGDFADGGIVGYAEAGSVRTPYMPENYRDTSAGEGVGGVYTATRLGDKGLRAAQSIMEDASTLSKYGTDAQTVVNSTRPLGRVGAAVKNLGPYAALAATGYDVYKTPLEQYEERFAFDHDPDRGLPAKAGIYALGAASDLGRTLTGGLVDPLYRDLQNKKAPKEPTKATPKPDDTIKIPPGEDDKYGIGAGMRLGTMPSTAARPGLEQLLKERRGVVDYDAFAKEEAARARESGDAETAVLRDYETGLGKLQEKAGVAGTAREKKLQARLDEMGGRTEKAKNDALVTAGLGILMAKPGGKGWRGAIAPIAAGAKGGIDQFREQEAQLRAERVKLDDSMDALLEARRQEELSTGKEKLAAHRDTQKSEAAVLSRINGIYGSIGLKKMEKDDDTFQTFVKLRESEATSKDASAREGASLSAKMSMYGGVGGGGKPLTPAQKLTALNALTDDIMKTPEGMGLTVAQARAMAEQMISQGPGAAPRPAGNWAVQQRSTPK